MSSWPSSHHLRPTARCAGSDGDVLLISRQPAPGAGAIAALRHPLLVDLGDDRAVAGEERFGGAHLGAERQLALAETVRAIFGVFRGAARGFRPAAAGAVGAFVHLATGAEIADPRILRRPEGTGIEAVAAADAQILVVEDDPVFRREDAFGRADRRAGGVGAMHAGHGDRTFAGLAVVDGDDPPAVDAPGDLVLVLAGGDAGVAIDAALGVAEEFHSPHGLPPRPLSSRRPCPWAPP